MLFAILLGVSFIGMGLAEGLTVELVYEDTVYDVQSYPWLVYMHSFEKFTAL
jgi:hypothetical protein